MGNVRLLRVVPAPNRCASDRQRLAQKLLDAADWIEGSLADGDGYVREDAVAVLRWSAGFLRRPAMREDDLAGTLRVVRRVLQDAIFAPGDDGNGLIPGRTSAKSTRSRMAASTRNLQAVR
ncbi:hypothetical protein [Dongia sp. agr-C8]